MNIDGVTAVIYVEMGVPAPLARGLFCLSHSVGLLVPAWEQMQQGERIQGLLPKARTLDPLNRRTSTTGDKHERMGHPRPRPRHLQELA